MSAAPAMRPSDLRVGANSTISPVMLLALHEMQELTYSSDIGGLGYGSMRTVTGQLMRPSPVGR